MNGSAYYHVLFENKLHPDHEKHFPLQSMRMPFGYRSHHELDLCTTTSVFPSTVPGSAPLPRQHKNQPAQKCAEAVTAPAVSVPKKIQQKNSLQRAVKEAKKRDGQLPRAQHDMTSAANQLVTTSSGTSDAMSVSTFRGSNGTITPPGSPKARKTPPLLLTNSDNDNFVAATSRKNVDTTRSTSSTCW